MFSTYSGFHNSYTPVIKRESFANQEKLFTQRCSGDISDGGAKLLICGPAGSMKRAKRALKELGAL